MTLPITAQLQNLTLAPVFPAQPHKADFNLVVEFAKSSLQVLNSIDFKSPWLHLPIISPSRIQLRFKVSNENSIFFINRKSLATLKESIKTFNKKEFFGIYVL